MENHIRLDDLLSRDVDVQWFEGVALVQSICQQLRALNISRPEFPPPSQTYLSADGSVAFAASSGGQGVVETAANVLAQMLNDDVPVRLRLVVTQATAGDGSYATLAELSEALAYFERPDSRQILRQLYERAQIASARPGPNTTSEPRPAVAAPPAAPDPAQLRPGHGISRVAVLVTLAAAILCAVIASVAFGYGDPRVFAALDRCLGIGRIREMCGIIDPSTFLLDLDFTLQIDRHALEVSNHALDLSHPPTLFLDLEFL